MSKQIALAKEEINLTTPLISTMIKSGLEEDLKKKIAEAIVNCCYSLGIDMPTAVLKMFINDILDVYNSEAITDVLRALKLIRVGELGTTYNKLNMITLRESMAIVMEDKAIKREEEHEKRKKQGLDMNYKIDYQAYIDRQKSAKDEEKKPTLSQMQYEAMRHDYFNNKKD